MHRIIFKFLFVAISLASTPLLLSAQVPPKMAVPKLYTTLENHFNKNEFEACVKLENDITKFSQQRKDTLATNSMYYLADAHYQLGELDKAILWREKQRDLLKELKLDESYSTSIFNLTYLYLEAGLYDKAGIAADELLATDKKVFGVKSDEYVSSVLSVVDVYLQLDRLQDSQNLLQATLKQHEKGSLNYALLNNKIGDLYTYTGEYSKASKLLTEAQQIFKRELEDGSEPYIRATVNLGILHMEQGKYPEAEEDFENALKALPDKEQPAYLPTLNNLALVYQSLGQYERSEKTFQEIKEMDAARVGTTHPDYAITLSNLSLVYNDESKYADAEKVILEALEIQRKNDETKSISYARKLNNLAKIYVFSGAPEKSIPLYLEALEIFGKSLGEETADYATVLYNLGVAHLKTNKLEDGVEFLRKSAALRAKVLGKKHPKYAESRQKIAEYQWLRKQRKEARVTFGEVFENYYTQIESTFPVLTEEEKAKFYYNTLRPSFEKFNSFAVEFYNEDPSILSEVYNHQLNTKAAIMLATEKVKESIYGSKNATLIAKFDEWQSMKEKLAKLQSHNENPERLDSLLEVASSVEKDLVRESSEFAQQFIRKRFTWQEVQKALKPGEAAVEVVRFNTYTPEAGGKFNDQVTYALLIVTAQTKNQPDIILMTGGNDMEGRSLKFHRNTIQLNQDDSYSYKKYFEPLGDYLKKKKISKFYLSPDGVYNQINLNTIKNTFSNKYLIDEFTIIRVTNTRELAELKPRKSNSQSSVLMGFPKFNLDGKETPAIAKSENRSLRGGGLNRSLRGGLLRYVGADNGIAVLPGTQVEIKEINSLFTTKATVYTEHQASERLAKSMTSPRILHVATHGYFLEDEKGSGDGSNHYVFNPLLKSGLILAGAENFLRTGVPVDSAGEDGILTAYEAMNLHLEDTDIVVLSACETGLGDVKNGEGVYGLQRAFKLSGAKSVVMSLWSVDDEATKQLMIYFYEQYLKSNDAHTSLRSAQQKLKQKYPTPFYWGAFVVVGL